jgi:siroheme synthase (precorrin-2 oxidase/ferrochelatase)
LVNVADDASYSDFVSPAILKVEEMTIAVGSNGTNVKASIGLRNKIRNLLGIP